MIVYNTAQLWLPSILSLCQVFFYKTLFSICSWFFERLLRFLAEQSNWICSGLSNSTVLATSK